MNQDISVVWWCIVYNDGSNGSGSSFSGGSSGSCGSSGSSNGSSGMHCSSLALIVEVMVYIDMI